MSNTAAQAYLKELNAEYKATRKCLENISESVYSYKPHPKSMEMGYLALLVAEIPLWVKYMVTDGEIDFVTFPHFKAESTNDLLTHFEENMNAARKALDETTDEALQESFTLKANGKVMYTTPKIADIGATLNHWVHHRGQLTVYMRLNDIPVPSIYGPSADDRSFSG